MRESLKTEYKASWQDEYLKWVCGFANVHGGTIAKYAGCPSNQSSNTLHELPTPFECHFSRRSTLA